MTQSILCNVNRCVGCWTCDMACKVAYDLPVDEHRIFVETIGGNGVDLPGGQWPNLYMKWKPVFTSKCLNCVVPTRPRACRSASTTARPRR